MNPELSRNYPKPCTHSEELLDTRQTGYYSCGSYHCSPKVTVYGLPGLSVRASYNKLKELIVPGHEVNCPPDGDVEIIPLVALVS
jgi:hypothetical protein